MSIKKINQFPDGSGSLTNDDVFLFMDDPSGSGVTKKISLSEISNAIGGGNGGYSIEVVQLGNVSGTINTNMSLGNIFDATLMSSGTIANPTNGTDGQTVRWRITYGNNNIILNLGNKFQIPNSATTPLPISTASGLTDLLGATYDSSRDKWDIIAFIPGY